jgi:hypothetical protein
MKGRGHDRPYNLDALTDTLRRVAETAARWPEVRAPREEPIAANDSSVPTLALPI